MRNADQSAIATLLLLLLRPVLRAASVAAGAVTRIQDASRGIHLIECSLQPLARLTNVFLRGPLWRRLLGLLPLALVACLASPGAAAIWFLVTVPLYQSATLLQWSTGHTPAGVPFGRLLLADPASRFFCLTLVGHALFRMILLSGDLVNRDLRQFGKGHWVEAAYIRTAMLLEGKIELHQTGSIRGLFAVAFRPSADSRSKPLAPRQMASDKMLQM